MNIKKRFVAVIILLPFVTVVFHVILSLAQIVHVIEKVEHYFPWLSDIPTWFWDVFIAFSILSIFLALERLYRLVRIRLLKFKHNKHNHAFIDADKQLINKNKKVNEDINIISNFLFAVAIISFLSEVFVIEDALKYISSIFLNGFIIQDHIYFAIMESIVFYFCAVGRVQFINFKLQNIDLPYPTDNALQEFAPYSNSKLKFRKAENKKDVIDLAKTENYGDIGETNIEQVYNWLVKYPNGNWLAIYDGKIIGGIDIWPINKKAYLNLSKGKIGEEEIDENSLAPQRNTKEGTYWYVASISLAMVWRQSKHRREILGRLMVDAIENNFKPNIKKYPAKVIALIWTKAGANIALNFGFIQTNIRNGPHIKPEPIYQAIFNTPEEVDKFVNNIRNRLQY